MENFPVKKIDLFYFRSIANDKGQGTLYKGPGDLLTIIVQDISLSL